MSMDGILLINKPQGLTSHDVVLRIRRKLKIRRVGHAGTLDPLATGLLIILLGKSTKLFNDFAGLDKAYRATMILGTKTTSADTQGEVLEKRSFAHITQPDIEKILLKFLGETEQVPPMVSAVKVKGQRLYELARKGMTVERAARKVKVHTLKLESFEPPCVKFYLECSKGMYVRQLAEDVGTMLGCGACISQIERVKVGDFHIKDAVNLEDCHEGHLRH